MVPLNTSQTKDKDKSISFSLNAELISPAVKNKQYWERSSLMDLSNSEENILNEYSKDSESINLSDLKLSKLERKGKKQPNIPNQVQPVPSSYQEPSIM